jgi:hypothetical protein
MNWRPTIVTPADIDAGEAGKMQTSQRLELAWKLKPAFSANYACRSGSRGFRDHGKVKSALTNQDALGSAALPQVCQTYETECRVAALFGKDHLSNRLYANQ